MRLLTLAVLAGLAITSPGCVLIGATVGSAVGSGSAGATDGSHHGPATKPNSKVRGALIGAAIGLALDFVVIAGFVSTVDGVFHNVPGSCPGGCN
jgi:hypothetical protein